VPQLPSGLHVAISIDPIIEIIRAGDLSTHLSMIMGVGSADEMAPITSIVYYRGEQAGFPSDPYLPGMTVSDVMEGRSGWAADDVQAFQDWQQSPKVQTWLSNSFQQLTQAVNETKVKVPEALQGILEG
jgi:hypothetical protein